jgi:DNA polymerase epsilon subunit 2
LDKLQRVLQGYEQLNINPLFVFMGTFVTHVASKGFGPSITAFNSLGEIIAGCPRLANEAKFILIPGPEDVGDNACLPRRGISVKLVEGLKRKVKHVTLGSNPCRVKFFTQEIVLFRENLTKKMQRHAVVLPDASENLTEQVVSVLLDEAHLCPLPLQSRPIIWGLDYTLHLTPLPHLIVLGDSSANKFEYDKNGCVVVNPGSFTVDSSFLSYHPSTRDIEFSKL